MRMASFTDVLRAQLIAASQTFDTLSTHPGLAGTGREEAIKHFLRQFLPRKYEVLSGNILHRALDGSIVNQNRQLDLMVVNTIDYPVLSRVGDLCFALAPSVKFIIESKSSQEPQQGIEQLYSYNQQFFPMPSHHEKPYKTILISFKAESMKSDTFPNHIARTINEKRLYEKERLLHEEYRLRAFLQLTCKESDQQEYAQLALETVGAEKQHRMIDISPSKIHQFSSTSEIQQQQVAFYLQAFFNLSNEQFLQEKTFANHPLIAIYQQHTEQLGNPADKLLYFWIHHYFTDSTEKIIRELDPLRTELAEKLPQYIAQKCAEHYQQIEKSIFSHIPDLMINFSNVPNASGFDKGATLLQKNLDDPSTLSFYAYREPSSKPAAKTVDVAPSVITALLHFIWQDTSAEDSNNNTIPNMSSSLLPILPKEQCQRYEMRYDHLQSKVSLFEKT